MKRRILISFGKYSDARLKDKAEYIGACMANNPSFPSPVPTLAELEAALEKYSDDLLAAEGHDAVKVAEKNKSRLLLEGLLRQLGMFVMYVANGDGAILASSGYTLAKIPEPGKITNPGNVTLSNGVTSGEMQSSVKAVKYARIYSHELTDQFPAENATWTSVSATTRKYLFKNLLRGKEYWVRIGVVGTDGQVAYSNVASWIIQ